MSPSSTFLEESYAGAEDSPVSPNVSPEEAHNLSVRIKFSQAAASSAASTSDWRESVASKDAALPRASDYAGVYADSAVATSEKLNNANETELALMSSSELPSDFDLDPDL
jgi:hypothetical protein